MNDKLKKFAKQTLKEGLDKLPTEWQHKFKLMYGRGGFTRKTTTRTVEETAKISIDQIVDEMPDDKLDWAMTQIDNSLKKLMIYE